MILNTRAPNEQAAYEAGKNGWPSPKEASPHNYSEQELEAWRDGRTDRIAGTTNLAL